MFKEAFGSSRFVSRLTIKNAKPSDEGRYECTASLGDLGRQFNIPDTKASFNYRPNIGKKLFMFKQKVTNKILNNLLSTKNESKF